MQDTCWIFSIQMILNLKKKLISSKHHQRQVLTLQTLQENIEFVVTFIFGDVDIIAKKLFCYLGYFFVSLRKIAEINDYFRRYYITCNFFVANKRYDAIQPWSLKNYRRYKSLLRRIYVAAIEFFAEDEFLSVFYLLHRHLIHFNKSYTVKKTQTLLPVPNFPILPPTILSLSLSLEALHSDFRLYSCLLLAARRCR